jgi:hypothetical protein
LDPVGAKPDKSRLKIIPSGFLHRSVIVSASFNQRGLFDRHGFDETANSRNGGMSIAKHLRYLTDGNTGPEREFPAGFPGHQGHPIRPGGQGDPVNEDVEES